MASYAHGRIADVLARSIVRTECFLVKQSCMLLNVGEHGRVKALHLRDQLVPGEPAQLVPGEPGQLVPGEPEQVVPGEPGQLVPGEPAQLVPGEPGQLVPGEPAQLVPG